MLVKMSRLVWLSVLATACGSDDPIDSAWMSTLPDERGLAELSIPGTHDSGALYELGTGTARTQELTIEQQLELGVRYFDIRCRNVADVFEIYHGPLFQQQTFDEVLATMSAFLDAHPRQTLVMSIKEEFDADRATKSFGAVFEGYVAQTAARWFLEPRVPSLGEARGRIVLVRRFASAITPMGIDAHTMWADDTTFTIQTGDAVLRVQDNYEVEDNDVKWSSITALFDEARDGAPTTWFINHTSAFQKAGSLPNTPVVAFDINERLNTYFADPAHAGRLGTVVMDFVNKTRVEAVIARNEPR